MLVPELQAPQSSVNLNIRCDRLLRAEEEFWVWIQLNLVLIQSENTLLDCLDQSQEQHVRVKRSFIDVSQCENLREEPVKPVPLSGSAGPGPLLGLWGTMPVECT
ncbi:unnamed protein product [Pleuronectes platessa]|uniref:Uncharacterized protein n=1 Tax=Pleuronectes platessa TaxID=8262 RepID=A0A9N7TXX4_PLEPL|nr:unnamed protein product [Pleuronectes platessa]